VTAPFDRRPPLPPRSYYRYGTYEEPGTLLGPALIIVAQEAGAFSQLDNAVTDRKRDSMRSVKRVELANAGLNVLVDGSLGYVKNFADLPGRFAIRNPAENLDLSSRQQPILRRLSSAQRRYPASRQAALTKSQRVCV
jgi:hypothetical protein